MLLSRISNNGRATIQRSYFLASGSSAATRQAPKNAKAGNNSMPYRVLYQEKGHQMGMKRGTEP